MTVDKKLLEILVCPKCKSAVEFDGDATIRCTSCGNEYPVVDGIPHMLVTEDNE